MKFTKLLLMLITILIAGSANAQSPQAIPYQAVARDVNGGVLASQNIALQFSIHDGNATGPVVYQETQSVTTNTLGLFSVNLGQGTPVSGTLATVNWGSGDKFLQVEMDPAGGTAYTDMGTTQLMSVPYALYAGSSNGWITTGNAGTTPATNSLGTTDDNDLVIKTDNFETARLFSNPETGGGLNTPTDRLRLMRTGMVNQKWPMVASFQLGSYEPNIEGRTQMDIALLYGSGVNADNKVMSLLANGNIGIGNTTPHAPLQFGNYLMNRKLVLYETNNNDHEFLGLGINPGMLRYQVANAGDNHVFFSGNGANASNELMRITGTGNVGIGTSSPSEQLHTTGGVRHESLSGTGIRLVYSDANGKLINRTNDSSLASYSATPNVFVPSGCGGVGNSITVSGYPASVASSTITVRLNIVTSWDEDVRAYLIAPNGDILNLLFYNGLFTDNFTNTVLSDTATNFLSSTYGPFTGSFKPAADMSTYCGITPNVSSFSAIGGGSINPNGVWSLVVYDDITADPVTLVDWSINILPPTFFLPLIGTNNYLPKWVNGNLSPESNVFDNGTRVGIGTTSPSAKLDVAGSTKTATLQITNGASNGAVLTSDANGNALWVAPSVNNVGCVIRAQTFTASASGTGYAAGGAFAPTTITATGIYGDTRLINSGAMNVTTGSATNTGLFTAPSNGYYEVCLKAISVASNVRLILLGSLNGASPVEILDQLTSNPCASCSDISHTQIIYMQAGDTHRILRSASGTTINDMVISYRKL